MTQSKKRPRNATPPSNNNGRRVTRRTSPNLATPPQLSELRQSRYPDARGEYTIKVWEGSTSASAVPGTGGLVGRFARLCVRSGSSIEKAYTEDLLKDASHRRNTTFVIAAVHSVKAYIAALAHCTLHSGLPGIAPRRIVFIDLVCSDANRKGIGAVLLKELEAYAQDVLGARALVLQSVLNPATQRAYYGKGFERGVGNRGPETLDRANKAFRILDTLGNADLKKLLACTTGACRQRLARQLQNVNARPTAEWKQALGREYYPPYNSLYSGGNAFVMTKRLAVPNAQPQPRQWFPWLWRGSTANYVAWGNRNGHATFRAPTVRVLGQYKRDATTGRLQPFAA